MSRRLRVGAVGLRRGLALVRVFARHPSCEVAALCDRDPHRLDAASAELGAPTSCTEYEELLAAGLDIVIVASPLPEHAAHSIAALEAGCHVLCEVPAVASFEEAARLVGAVRESRGIYMLAENCCYWAFVEEWQRMVAAGRLGEPMYAEAEYVHDCRSLLRDPDGSPTWRAALPPIRYCTHSLGPILKVIGGRCVTAVGMSSGSRLSPELGTIDAQVALLRTDRGVPIKILCAFGVAREPAFHTYTVYGTSGCLEKPRNADETLAYFEAEPKPAGMTRLPLGTRHPDAPEWATVGGHGTAEWAMVGAFVDAILNGRPSPIDVHGALEMTLPGLCVDLSSRRGSEPVTVPDLR